MEKLEDRLESAQASFHRVQREFYIERRKFRPAHAYPPSPDAKDVCQEAGIETSDPRYLAQKTLEGEIWYLKEDHERRMSIQSQVIDLLSTPVRERDWEESAHPFHAGLMLAAALLVGVPERDGGSEDDSPLTGLDFMAVLRWVKTFLDNHGLGSSSYRYLNQMPDIGGGPIPSSESQPGHVGFLYDQQWRTRPMIKLPNNELLGSRNGRILTLDIEYPHTRVAKVFTPLEWPKEVRPDSIATPGTWLQYALLDSYRLGEGVRGVKAVFLPK